MKTLLTNLVKNALEDLITTAAGTVIGLPQIIEGFTSHNWFMIVEGFGKLIIGLSVNLKK